MHVETILFEIRAVLVSVDEVFCISCYGADGVLLAITADSLGTVGVFPAAAIPQVLHY